MNGDEEKGKKILTTLLHFSFSFQEDNWLLCIEVVWEDGKVQVSWELNEETPICVAQCDMLEASAQVLSSSRWAQSKPASGEM